MRKLAVLLFLGFLALLVGPDAMPGVPIDDVFYAVMDILLAHYIFKTRRKNDGGEGSEKPAENPISESNHHRPE